METLQLLLDSDAITTDDFIVKSVRVTNFDYSKHPVWAAQKKVCDKEYKKLTAIEFEIRQHDGKRT